MKINDIQSTGSEPPAKDSAKDYWKFKQNGNVVGLTADLMESLQMQHFQKEFPERFFQVGIAEANMIGIAARITAQVKFLLPAPLRIFSTGRVYDQIRQSVAYSHKNVKICASRAGVTLGEDGVP